MENSEFDPAMSDKDIVLNRKILSELAISDSQTFKKIVETAIK